MFHNLPQYSSVVRPIHLALDFCGLRNLYFSQEILGTTALVQNLHTVFVSAENNVPED